LAVSDQKHVRRDGAPDAFTHGLHVVLACAGKYDEELLTAGADEDVTFAQGEPCGGRCVAEHPVPSQVAVGVVDGFEVIEVEGE